MGSTLELAQRVKQKSEEQARILEEAQNSALSQLKESMTQSLSESESIINSAIQNLSLSSEELQNLSTRHLQNIQSATDNMLLQYQTHLQTRLKKERLETMQMIETYSEQTQNLIETKQQSIIDSINYKSKVYLIGGSMILIILMLISALFGAAIAKYVIDQQVLIYQYNPITKETKIYQAR